ncbi:DUF397 domain-containing protein [Streptomyces sp. BE147]|uniref:DUF397 domain-containing protein n=1 Tax=Streptomyces sp. BE147 TaxID=3002524 RepID=UPI002E792FC1|nr:DUF397 domain-containing protein [Streptomyces sp. BE147]MEE1736985.1 DUF397 domain-containing protein [Streptomyces sp. BE147]
MTTRAEKDALYALDISGAQWQAAPGSDPENRFEIALLPNGAVALRDPNAPDDRDLRYTATEWEAYCKGAADGEFDKDLSTTR